MINNTNMKALHIAKIINASINDEKTCTNTQYSNKNTLVTSKIIELAKQPAKNNIGDRRCSLLNASANLEYSTANINEIFNNVNNASLLISELKKSSQVLYIHNEKAILKDYISLFLMIKPEHKHLFVESQDKYGYNLSLSGCFSITITNTNIINLLFNDIDILSELMLTELNKRKLISVDSELYTNNDILLYLQLIEKKITSQEINIDNLIFHDLFNKGFLLFILLSNNLLNEFKYLLFNKNLPVNINVNKETFPDWLIETTPTFGINSKYFLVEMLTNKNDEIKQLAKLITKQFSGNITEDILLELLAIKSSSAAGHYNSINVEVLYFVIEHVSENLLVKIPWTVESLSNILYKNNLIKSISNISNILDRQKAYLLFYKLFKNFNLTLLKKFSVEYKNIKIYFLNAFNVLAKESFINNQSEIDSLLITKLIPIILYKDSIDNIVKSNIPTLINIIKILARNNFNSTENNNILKPISMMIAKTNLLIINEFETLIKYVSARYNNVTILVDIISLLSSNKLDETGINAGIINRSIEHYLIPLIASQEDNEFPYYIDKLIELANILANDHTVINENSVITYINFITYIITNRINSSYDINILINSLKILFKSDFNLNKKQQEINSFIFDKLISLILQKIYSSSSYNKITVINLINILNHNTITTKENLVNSIIVTRLIPLILDKTENILNLFNVMDKDIIITIINNLIKANIEDKKLFCITKYNFNFIKLIFTAINSSDLSLKSLAIKLYDDYLNLDEIKTLYQHKDFINLFNNFTGCIDWNNENSENYILLKDDLTLLISNKKFLELSNFNNNAQFAKWHNVSVLKSGVKLNPAELDINTLYNQYFKLFKENYTKYFLDAIV